jgi:hypothetical protein
VLNYSMFDLWGQTFSSQIEEATADEAASPKDE